MADPRFPVDENSKESPQVTKDSPPSPPSSPLRQVALALLACAVTLGLLLTTVAPAALWKYRFPEWSHALSLLAMGVWGVAYVVERKRGRLIPGVSALMAGMALASVLLQHGPSSAAIFYGKPRVHTVFHYYLGAKYFNEIGYFDLYRAGLAADDQWVKMRTAEGKPLTPLKGKVKVKDLSFVVKTRSMETYKLIPREEAVADYHPLQSFTKERWKEFRRDTLSLYGRADQRHWKNTFLDLGFNPSPVWMVLGKPFCELVDLDAGMWFISNSDLPLILLTILLMGWAFGVRAAAMGTLWLCAIDFNDGHLYGALFQHDWLLCTVGAVCLYHKGWAGTAGGLLAWGAMTRVFPGFLVAPIAFQAVVQFLQGRSLWAVEARRRRFLALFTATSLVLFGASLTTGRGLSAWPQWVEKIGRHSSTHATTSSQRIGVAKMAIHQVTEGKFWGTAPGREQALMDRTAPKRHALQALGLLLLLPALWKRRDEDAMILMFFTIFLAVTLSRYYNSIWMLIPALGMVDVRSPSRFSTTLATMGLLSTSAFYFFPGNELAGYYLVNYLFYFTFCGLCLHFIGSDLGEAWKRRRRGQEPTHLHLQRGVREGAQESVSQTLCFAELPLP